MAPGPTPPGTLRRSQEDKEKTSGTGTGRRKLRSHSFHHGKPAVASDKHSMPMRRLKTQPDLLSPAVGFRRPPPNSSSSRSSSDGQRLPAKLLVHVTLHSSLLGPLQVMASAEWCVDQLVAAALRLYINERRRPLLPTSDPDPDPSHFGLHYSQFSLECLDPKEKLINLGSRNFFLCPTTISASASAMAAATAPSTTYLPPQSRPLLSPPPPSSCSKEAKKASKIAAIPWLRFINSLL